MAAIHKAGTDDGWHGIIREGGYFKPEKDRYHLYIGLFCPFAHRVSLVRHLKGLQHFIPVSVVKPYPKGDDKGWPGWQFPWDDVEYPGATVDHLFGSKYLHEIYFKADPQYQGRYSVPVLWDKKRDTIVNNESAELLRWLPHAFETGVGPELYPFQHGDTIDSLSSWMQRELNSRVYKAGFASDQATYEKHVIPVFAALNTLEEMMASNGGPYLLGPMLTELDIRLFTTLIRFDPVYVQHFKCNLGTIRHEYPQLNNWMKNLYWNHDAFGEATTDFTHIKENYTKSHGDINPKGITPMGPWPDVEGGWEPDLRLVVTGRIIMDEVVEYCSSVSDGSD